MVAGPCKACYPITVWRVLKAWGGDGAEFTVLMYGCQSPKSPPPTKRYP